MRVSAVHFWHSEGWAPRNEVKQVRTTRHLWLVACDATLDLKDFRTSLWFKEKCMFIEAPEEGTSTRRSTGPKGELNERTYDYDIASRSLQRQRDSRCS